MNHQLLVAEYLATPWALMPERLNAVTAVIARWSGDARASDEVMRNIAVDKNARDARRQSSVSNSGAS